MKKLLLFASAVAFAASAVVAQTDTDTDDDAVTFRADGILYMVNTQAPGTVTVMEPGDGYAAETLTIPATVTDEATSLTYTVTAIGNQALCSSKTQTVVIPATVTDIAGDAFFSANYLTTISVAPDNVTYAAVDGVLYSKTMDRLLCFPANKSFGSFALPETVTELGDYAFCGVWLNAFEIPARITKIGYGAFMGTKLKKMTVPATVTEMKGGVFQNCNRLETIDFQNTMTVFPDHTLTYCSMLKSFTLPAGITEIGDYAFDGTFIYGSSYGLVGEFVCPESLKTIGIGAFNGDRGLTKLTLNSSLESIGMYAFARCSALTEIKSYNTTVPACLDEDGNNDVLYCFSEVPETCILYVPEAAIQVYTDSWGAKFKDIRTLESLGNVDAIAADDMQVTVSGDVIEVVAAAPVEIFNSLGVRVAYSAGNTLQAALSKGYYIVRSGNNSVKVIL